MKSPLKSWRNLFMWVFKCIAATYFKSVAIKFVTAENIEGIYPVDEFETNLIQKPTYPFTSL